MTCFEMHVHILKASLNIEVTLSRYSLCNGTHVLQPWLLQKEI